MNKLIEHATFTFTLSFCLIVIFENAKPLTALLFKLVSSTRIPIIDLETFTPVKEGSARAVQEMTIV